MSDASNYPAGMPESLKVCEECGDPTTVVVADLDELEPIVGEDGRTWANWKPREHHGYCGTHARCGLYYRLDGRVEEECERAGEPCEGAAAR